MRGLWLALALILSLGARADAQFMPLGLGAHAGGGGGSIALVQHVFTNCGGGPYTTCAAAITGVVSGHMLGVGIAWCGSSGPNCSSGSPAITSITDTLGNTCAAVSGAGAGGSNSASIWECPNVIGGSDTLTVTWTSNTVYAAEVDVFELSGAASSSPSEVGNARADAAGGGGGGPYSLATSGATTVSGDFVYSVMNEAFQTATANQTAIVSGSSSTTLFYDEYQLGGAPAVYTNSWNFPASPPYSIVIAAFKP